MIVNGLPGAGKSTLARSLAAALGLPLFCKDDVKETLADILGAGPVDPSEQRSWSRALGAAAMEAIWTLLAQAHAGAVIEANLLASTRVHAVAGLDRAATGAAVIVVEVWCEIPAWLARKRFEARASLRHPIHGPQVGLDQLWAQWATEARPLAVGRVVAVDTSSPVDLTRLTLKIRSIMS